MLLMLSGALCVLTPTLAAASPPAPSSVNYEATAPPPGSRPPLRIAMDAWKQVVENIKSAVRLWRSLMDVLLQAIKLAWAWIVWLFSV